MNRSAPAIAGRNNHCVSKAARADAIMSEQQRGQGRMLKRERSDQ